MTPELSNYLLKNDHHYHRLLTLSFQEKEKYMLDKKIIW